MALLFVITLTIVVRRQKTSFSCILNPQLSLPYRNTQKQRNPSFDAHVLTLIKCPQR
jgi:hypothetical protein